MPRGMLMMIAALVSLGAGAALAQSNCERTQTPISCPDGQTWDATAQVCRPPLSS